MRRPRAALAASPVLIGAVTVLITVIAVFISYNANQGLPFVPSYDLKAQLPNGYKLVPGNDVRAGGFRVGVVNKISVGHVSEHGKTRTVALLDLKLDKRIEPLPVDTRMTVRPRSALGLKYVELVPGRSRHTFEPGATIPVQNAQARPVELEDVLSTFDPATRENARTALQGFGDVFAGRGPALNQAIGALNPLLRHLLPVMRTLRNPDTELAGFFPRLGAAVAQVAPVAQVNAQLFADMANTFHAINRDPRSLQATIEESPATLDASIRSVAVQTPFLDNFIDLSYRLRPAAVELRRALPPINSALAVGAPVLARVPQLSGQLAGVFGALTDLGRDPSTLPALRDLRQGLGVTRPLLDVVAPYQTVCNEFVYFLNPLGTHQSQVTAGGTVERILAKLVSPTQKNTMADTHAIRPVDVPIDKDPQANPPMQALHTQNLGPAVDSQGRADCQNGQTGYISRLVNGGRYPPEPSGPGFQGGGSHVVLEPDTPGRAGGSWIARKLGIDSVRDVP